MEDKPGKEPGAWDSCTWGDARRDVLELGSRLSFREKILWLEEGARLALAFQAAREQPRTDPAEPHG